MNGDSKRWIIALTDALKEPAYKLIFAIFVVFLTFGIGSTIYGIIRNETLYLYLAFLSFVIVSIDVVIVVSIVESRAAKLKTSSIEDKIKELEKTLKTEFKLLSEPKIEKTIAEYLRKDLIDFIINCSTNHLNKFETINHGILNLYRRHGLLELTNEPQKSKMRVKYKYEKELGDDMISVMYIKDYRATNEALESCGINKLVNGSGLVAYTSIDFIKNLDENKISEEIHKYIKPILKLKTSFTTYGLKQNEEIKLSPELIPEKNFDHEKVRMETKSKPTLYGVYDVLKKEENYKIDLNLYLFVEIPPKQHIDFHIETAHILPNFYLMSDDFLSWTDGIHFELQFGDKFDTDISYTIPGEPPSLITKTELIYQGWIMPHSSISAVWKKKNL